MTHQIRQQFLEVELTGSEAEGLKIQRLLPDLYYRELLPAIEKAFDEFFPDEKVLKIDYLEINAGPIKSDRINQDFVNVVLTEIIKVIQEKIINSDTSQDNTEFSDSGLKSTSENLANVFIHFLKTGNLPWFYRLKEGVLLETVLMAEFNGNWIISESSHILQKIKEVLYYPTATKRLVHQFSHIFQLTLLQWISQDVSDIYVKVSSFFDNRTHPTEIKNELRKVLFESAFIYASVAEHPTESGFIRQMAENLPARLKSQTEIGNFIKSNFDYGDKIPESKQNGKAHITSIRGPSKEGFYIENAGLILLHPFFPPYFEALGITKGNEMFKPVRALRLLQFLVSGQTAPPEYELVLPKILCEYPLIEPVASDDPINENESDESLALLTAVILHWSALRNTGPDALRETFLKRPGKLYQENNGDWMLIVEAQTFDVLLNHLPWGIGKIKLPWMKQVLRVEWIV